MENQKEGAQRFSNSHTMKRVEETGNDHEIVDANWSGIRMAMAVATSFCFILMLVGVNIVYDIESTRAEIPAVFEGKSLIETLSPKRKHHPIDDFPLTTPETKTASSLRIDAV